MWGLSEAIQPATMSAAMPTRGTRQMIWTARVALKVSTGISDAVDMFGWGLMRGSVAQKVRIGAPARCCSDALGKGINDSSIHHGCF